MKKVFSIIIALAICLMLFSCSKTPIKEKADTDHTTWENETTVTKSNEEDLQLKKAKEVFTQFLDYYEKDFSCVIEKGLIDLSGYKYAVFEAIGYDGYSYYVSVNENYDIYGAYPDSGMDLIWKDGKPANSNATDDKQNTPFAPITFNVLDSSFLGYKNQTGTTFFELTQQESLAPFYIKKVDSIKYYYESDGTVIGVNEEGVCLLTGMPSSIVGKTSPQIREVIKGLDAEELFEIYPAVIEVSNSYNSISFFYWEIENGYIGFGAIGGNDPLNCYNYVATHFVLFDNLSVIGS